MVTIYIIRIMMKSGFVCLKNNHFLELHQEEVCNLFRDVSKKILTSKHYDPACQALSAKGRLWSSDNDVDEGVDSDDGDDG